MCVVGAFAPVYPLMYYDSILVNNINSIAIHVVNAHIISKFFLFYPRIRKILSRLNTAFIYIFFLFYGPTSSCATTLGAKNCTT